MEKRAFLYEGKAKRIFQTDDPDLLIVEFKDVATAFDGLKKENLEQKGILNNAISSIFFELLGQGNMPTHYVKKLGEREMLVKSLQIIPVEIIVRNIAAGSLCKRMGLEEGTILQKTVLEHNLKDDELHDPMLNRYHIYALDLATSAEMDTVEEMALQINDFLRPFLLERNIVLVDFKLEFGRHKGSVILGDEITPDTCRFWDAASGEKLDKDRFRREMGKVTEAYQEVLRRLQEVE